MPSKNLSATHSSRMDVTMKQHAEHRRRVEVGAQVECVHRLRAHGRPILDVVQHHKIVKVRIGVVDAERVLQK